MGLLIPIDMVDKSEYFFSIQKLKKTALEKAAQAITTVRGAVLIVRELKPSDLGRTDFVFNLAAGMNEGVVLHELDDKTMIVVHGIANQTVNPQLTDVEFATPAGVFESAHVEHLYTFDHPEGLFDNPIIYEPGSTIKINMVAANASAAEKVIIRGFVIEPAGRTISAVGGSK